MADIKFDFSNCDVSIEKMFDIHDNQNVNVYNNAPKSKNTSSKKGGNDSAPNDTPKPETQHGVPYPVFSKGLGVTEDHIKALYFYLTARGWISTQTKEVEFKRLFSGDDNNCEIIWTGQDKLGNNDATSLGISALYVLFKRMYDEGVITTSDKAMKVGPILESHFVDTKRHFLTKVSNTSTASAKANNYINQILATMHMRVDKNFIDKMLNDDLSKLVEEEGEVKYDKYGG